MVRYPGRTICLFTVISFGIVSLCFLFGVGWEEITRDFFEAGWSSEREKYNHAYAGLFIASMLLPLVLLTFLWLLWNLVQGMENLLNRTLFASESSDVEFEEE